jgi:hypothetical protein
MACWQLQVACTLLLAALYCTGVFSDALLVPVLLVVWRVLVSVAVL